MAPRGKSIWPLLLAMLLSWQALRAQGGHAMRGIEDNWQFRKVGEGKWMPAKVPGCVQTDLQLNNQIPDPLAGQNARDIAWVEDAEWEYRCPIQLSPLEARAARKVIRFHGLDTYADVYLNGQLLLQADNMHREWEVDATPHLRGQADSLRIVFHSPNRVAAKAYAARGYRLPADSDTGPQALSPYTRKAAFQFGWDFAPRILTAGLWRPVTLHTYHHLRIQDFAPTTLSILPQTARLQAHTHLDVTTGGTYRILLLVDDQQVLEREEVLWPGKQHISLPFEIDRPKLWWPAGAGTPHRYNVAIRISLAGEVIDSARVKTGLRSIELRQDPSHGGTSFSFRVNGRDLFMRGANIVPADFDLARATRDRGHILRGIQAANMNMVRIWGGGVYPDDAFYDACDSLGILVWQDFMFAGQVYPFDDPAFRANVAEEVTQAVHRLRRHPCLALYCGNNEIDVAWFNWGWQTKYGIPAQDSAAIWQAHSSTFTEAIPAIIAQHHPGAPYVHTSPLSNWGHPDRYRSGNMHDWSVWHGGEPIDSLARRAPRFATEYGFQSWPGTSTLELYGSPEDLLLDSPWMQSRQRSYKGNGPILAEIQRLYGTPRDFAAFTILSQLVQARAMELAIEAHRTASPRCMGTLFWQLNDCWPGPSWSTIDYLGRWKAAHHVLPRLYAPVLISASDNGKDFIVKIASELQYPREATVQLRLKSFTGTIIGQQEKVISIPADSSAEVFRLPISRLASRFDRKATVLEATVHAGGNILATDDHYFVPVHQMHFPDPDFSYRVTEGDGHYLLSIEAKHLMKDVEIRVQGAEPQLSHNFFDFIPGRRYEVRISQVDAANVDDLLRRLRFRDVVRLLK